MMAMLLIKHKIMNILTYKYYITTEKSCIIHTIAAWHIYPAYKKKATLILHGEVQ